ncbi:insulinase family protein [Hahella sp. SMD15-11]|uniref:Protease 3 n=1 Tax=Thermohahella caldifontis TaxID=3142973 RepID=A0AB39UX56_9GAMM
MSTDGQIITSPNDERAYRPLTLDNGLQVLLVSDPQAEKASAAMDVAVGSQDDPPGREGLAHFLEHMLFLGTQKYPEAGEYQAFINQHGGSHNAFTAANHTNYFFDVDADYLEPALDRFAQQFVAPLFNPEYVEREKNAVHSEYTSKLKDDGRRLYAVLKQALNPAHPVARFAVGNLDTLADRPGHPVRDDLLAFYRTHYSPENMRLVVYGNQSLDTLEQWVREKFTPVPVQPLAQRNPLPPLLRAEDTGRLVQLKPVQDRRSLTLLFPVPSSRPYYRNKPLYYLTNLIGHEGEGSLLSWLKRQGLAEGLSAGTFMDDGHQSLLSISIKLTREGRARYQEVIQATEHLLDMIRQQGIERWRFEEQRKMLDIAFRFQERSQPIHFASSVAGRMNLFPLPHVLAAPYMMDQYDEQLLHAYTQALRPDNMLAVLVAPDAETDRTEPWYQVPHSIRALPEMTDSAQYADLHLPAPNAFIPDSVDWAPGEDQPHPVKLVSEPGLEAWWAHDLSFKTPKASFYVSIRSPVVNDSPAHFVAAQLLVDLVRDQLNEYVYPAYLAGLEFRLYRHMRGMTLRIDGYSEKQPVLLDKVTATLRHPVIRPERLAQFKEDLARQLRNQELNKPFEQLVAHSRNWMMKPYWNNREQLAALETITPAYMADYAQAVFAKVDLVTLGLGNMDEATARALNDVVRTRFVKTAEATAEVPRSRVVRLPAAVFATQKVVTHPDTGYLYYVQGQDKSWTDRARYALIGQIIGPWYYERLRTEKQLGYIVFASPYPVLEVPGLAFIVQSPRASGAELHQETQEALKAFAGRLNELSEQDFALHKQALITRLSERDKTLEQRADRYWTEIDQQHEQFDSRQQLIQAIEGLSRADVIETFRKRVADQPAAMLLTSRHEDDSPWRPADARPLPDKGEWQQQQDWFTP